MCAIEKPNPKAAPASSRLSESVKPSFYEIEITPDIQEATFSGKETITLKLAEATDRIVLQAAELAITKAKLRNSKGSSFDAEVEIDEAKQEAVFKLTGIAGKGEWFLDLSFSGILNNKLRGFYRSSFKDASGNEKFIATTKFEPSDARRAFPCFDEPSFKAVFQLSLVIDSNLQAVSNSRILLQNELAGGKKLVKFAPTIKMSSYLVAYIIGEFEATEPVFSESGAEIRVWCVPGKKHLTGFALKWAKRSLDYFASYFGIDYPADKLDLIAIPDFASGAMENFAAITFRETALLLDESRATHKELLRVAEVICHENAHMWFGDLVTMKWWNGLWLNEAFATFMSAKAVHAHEPEWKFWESFNIEKAGAMRVDGLHSSRSIEFPVASPEDARAMFDVLTYEKGCAILRMLELYMGEETFRQGCAIYMKRHAYANTETADLWNALAEAAKTAGSKIPVARMMDSWVFQKGFPLVQVEETESPGSIILRQRPFRYLEKDAGGKDSQLWYVPVALRACTADGIIEKDLAFCSAEERFYIAENLRQLVLNADGKGFYRVSYSDNLRERLLANYSELSASERFNFASDLWAACQAGELSLPAYINCLKQVIASESDANVFSVITGSLLYIRRIAAANDSESHSLASFSKLACLLLSPSLEKLGWDAAENESAGQKELRAALVSTLASMGSGEVLEKARLIWQEQQSGARSVEANLMPALIETVASHGDSAAYENFLKLKERAKTPQEESRFLFALSSFRRPELIERTLESTINGKIRMQDSPQMLRALFFNPEAGPASWQFLKKNWDQLVASYPLQGLIRLCEGITALVNPELENEIRAFFAEKNVRGNEKALAQNLETLSIANRFLLRESANFKNLA